MHEGPSARCTHYDLEPAVPRFVILEHDHPELHWDLMLEAGDVLRTWRLSRRPQKRSERIEATALPDHRLHYLDYEGPVSGGRGVVKRWDIGQYEQSSADQGMLNLELTGSRVQGAVRLTQLDGAGWVFEWQS